MDFLIVRRAPGYPSKKWDVVTTAHAFSATDAARLLNPGEELAQLVTVKSFRDDGDEPKPEVAPVAAEEEV